ncbi:hypothetical protein M569_12975 [Genlisea aurea]|uniref:Uncharacterized protein n=1 Tax=Genlisea aurea TaxID=192259 RepID=S8C539_9LAMI|nr:hypothetical protein M569_12975 [Genlisea aurea]
MSTEFDSGCGNPEIALNEILNGVETISEPLINDIARESIRVPESGPAAVVVAQGGAHPGARVLNPLARTAESVRYSE